MAQRGKWSPDHWEITSLDPGDAVASWSGDQQENAGVVVLVPVPVPDKLGRVPSGKAGKPVPNLTCG